MNNSNFLVCKPISLKLKNITNFTQLKRDFLYYIISIVTLHAQYAKDEMGFDYKRQRKKLDSKRLEKLYSGYKKIISFLGDDTNFDRSKAIYGHRYEKGKPYSYSLSNQYQKQIVEFVELENINLINKIKSFENKLDSKTKKKFGFITKSFENNYVKIDLNHAKAFWDSQYLNKEIDYYEYLYGINQMLMVYNSIYKISYDHQKNGRLYNPLTSINKELRDFIYIEYKSQIIDLAEADLSNSVPFILGLMMKEANKEDFSPVFENYNNQKFVKKFIKLGKDICEKELNQFILEVTNGTIYNQFIPLFTHYYSEEQMNLLYHNTFDEEFDGEEDQVRKLIKKTLLSMINSKKKDFKKMKAMFQSIYPSIHWFLMKLKENKFNSELSNLIYHVEFDTLINKIARDFNNKYNGKIQLLTVHDCIAVDETKVHELKQYIQDWYYKHYNMKPNVKIKYWCIDCIPK